MKNQIIENASEVKNSSSASTEAHETCKNKQGLIMFVMAVANQGGAVEQIPFEKRANRIATGRGNDKTVY